MKKLVSIITVTFNLVRSGRVNEFEELLDSLREQDYKNVEHIVIDGASDDGTVEILQKYSDEGRINFVSEPDKGIYDAFNKGILKANGEFIYFIGSDDKFYSTDAISKSVAALEKSGADFSYGDVYLLNEHKPKKSAVAKGILHNMFFKMSFCHQSVFMKIPVLKEYMFDDTFRISADYDMFLRLLKDGKSACRVNSVIAAFRTDGASSSKEIFNRERIAIFEKYFGLTEKQARILLEYNVMPFSKFLEFSKYFKGLDYIGYILSYVHFVLCMCRRNLIQIRTSKGKEKFVLLGIPVIKPSV